jgi:O-acetyl-ADP-ribose deacetylase (regulator of RNase III)
LLSECRKLHGCDTGDAKITKGYNLPAAHVIHTVGPQGEVPALLRSAYTRSLQVALENGCRTIAFPCISTGIYGYPHTNAALVAVKVVREFLQKHRDSFDLVIFCCFLASDIKIYRQVLAHFFPAAPEDIPAAPEAPSESEKREANGSKGGPTLSG